MKATDNSSNHFISEGWYTNSTAEVTESRFEGLPSALLEPHQSLLEKQNGLEQAQISELAPDFWEASGEFAQEHDFDDVFGGGKVDYKWMFCIIFCQASNPIVPIGFFCFMS